MNYSNTITGLDDRIAGFWRRFFAYITDLIIIQILYAILLITGFFAVKFGTEEFNIHPSFELILRLAVPFILIYFLLFIAYFTTFCFVGGQTPGKMIFGMKVVSRNGGGMSLGFSLVRSFGYFASSFFWLGFLIALSNKRRRALHDILSGSYVVRTNGLSTTKGDGPSPRINPDMSEPLICILLFLFIIFPAGISSGEIVDQVIAVVNNEVISLSDLKQHIALYSIRQRGIDFNEAKKNAIQELIDERLILAEASRFGIEEPTKAEIKNEEMKLEKNIQGQIEAKDKLSWYGLKPEDLYGFSRNRIIIKRFIDQRVNFFILIPPEEVGKYLKENRKEFKDISPEEARIKIAKMLTDERSKEKVMELKARLRSKANIKINVEE